MPDATEVEQPCWWVDFCRQGCPTDECQAAGCCAYPPADVVNATTAGDDE